MYQLSRWPPPVTMLTIFSPSMDLERMNICLGVAASLWIILTAPLCGAVIITFSPPTECDVMNISWTGGQPPFEFNFITVYGTQSPQQVPSSAFISNQGFYQTRIQYPSGTLFSFITQDAAGFPDGGTSGVLTVGPNTGDPTCDLTTNSPDFYFATGNYIQQCQPFHFSDYNNGSTPPITILGIVPGDEVFTLYPPSGSTDFEWTVSLPSLTTVLFTMVDAAGNRGRVTQLMTVEQTDDASCLSGPSTVPHTTTTRNGARPPSGSPSVTRPGPNRSSSSSRSSATSSPSSSLSTKPTSLSSGQIAGIAIGSSIAASLLIVCTVAFVALQAYRCGREAPDNNVVVVQNKEDGKSKPPPKQDEEAVITMPVLPPKDNPPRNANLVYIPNKGAMGVQPPSVRSLKHPVPKPPTPMPNPAPMPHTLPPPKAVNVAHKRRRVREGIVRQHVDHNRYMHTRPAGPAPYPPRMPNGGHPYGPLGLEVPPPGEEAANVRGRGVSASVDERYPYPAPVPGPGVMRNERYQRAGQVPDGPPPLVPRAPAGSQGFERPPPNRQRMAGGAARVDPRHLRPNPFPPSNGFGPGR